MFRQGPDFYFEISGIRDKRSRDNESQLYYIVSNECPDQSARMRKLQADLDLQCPHMPEHMFSHGANHLVQQESAIEIVAF